jgi:hypothetical protein
LRGHVPCPNIFEQGRLKNRFVLNRKQFHVYSVPGSGVILRRKNLLTRSKNGAIISANI